ncbi:MAG TPA: 50S ribosomal protein L18 [Phycisphaerae bacterium]|nr:50S ribosomal protein L18 [Phycisphaerae bacterium]
MKATVLKLVRRERRKRRVRRRVFGTPERPRLSVFRSLKNISAQLIDDEGGRTVCSASSLNKAVADQLKTGGNKAAATVIGQILAERARMQGIRKVAFDRSGYRYHGRIKALAEAARKAGLEF